MTRQRRDTELKQPVTLVVLGDDTPPDIYPRFLDRWVVQTIREVRGEVQMKVEVPNQMWVNHHGHRLALLVGHHRIEDVGTVDQVRQLLRPPDQVVYDFGDPPPDEGTPCPYDDCCQAEPCQRQTGDWPPGARGDDPCLQCDGYHVPGTPCFDPEKDG